MPDNQFWDLLIKPDTLKSGWNLARNDAKANFFYAPFYSDVFTISFENNIKEISKRLSSNTYRPAPLNFIDVPKGVLSIRTGSLPEIEDRIVLQAIVRLIAKQADDRLPESVYSYRVKNKFSRDSIFIESDVLDIPYLKSKTISRKIDPFDPWYAAWPEFDEESKESFQKDGFKYLVVTDIAAYFENIQLPLLRDTLFDIFPHEQKIINLVLMFLESWCPSTDQYRQFHRGIPQGTQISSFLGNLFLLPLDLELQKFSTESDAKYFRYMDDIRVFTKDYPTARRAVLLMDKVIRSLHLNTQSAKTEILSEDKKEITHRLIDIRLTQINEIIEEIRKAGPGGLESKRKFELISSLHKIANQDPESPFETRIFSQEKPLKGLTFRVFRRWLTAYSSLGRTAYLPHLLKEIKRNPDYRLTRKIVTVTKESPKLTKIGPDLLAFIKSDLNIFPHQHAEIIWSFRYLSNINDEVVQHCKERVLDDGEYYYVRSSAGLLLTQIVLDKKFLDECRKKFDAIDDANVRIALALLLMQSTGVIAGKTLHMLVFHPHEKIRNIGKLLRQVRYDKAEADKRMKYLFSGANDWIICDNISILHSISLSDRPEILKMLIENVSSAARLTVRKTLRGALENIEERAQQRLRYLAQ